MRDKRVMATVALMAAGIAVLAAGCIPSLHPLYTEKDLVFDPGLLGVWAEKDADASKDSWEFAKAEEKGYELAVTEEGVTAKFEAHLVRLGEYRFLDTAPTEWTAEGGPEHELLSYHLIPGHLFWKAWMKEGVLYLALLDPEWIDEKLDKGELGVAYEEVEDGIVLTARTTELQEFVLRAVKDPKAFTVGEPVELHRQEVEEKEGPPGIDVRGEDESEEGAEEERGDMEEDAGAED